MSTLKGMPKKANKSTAKPASTARPASGSKPATTAKRPAAGPPAGTTVTPAQFAWKPPSTSAAVRPVPASKAADSDYVHFSDKMTGALMNINRVIDDNRGTLDSIQDMAVQLTRTVSALRIIIMRYVDMADNILETVVPIMDNLPIFPDSFKEFAKDALALSKKISAASEMAEKVLPGVERSLTTADIASLQNSTGDVAGLTRVLQDLLPDKK